VLTTIVRALRPRSVQITFGVGEPSTFSRRRLGPVQPTSSNISTSLSTRSSRCTGTVSTRPISESSDCISTGTEAVKGYSST